MRILLSLLEIMAGICVTFATLIATNFHATPFNRRKNGYVRNEDIRMANDIMLQSKPI